MYISKDYSYIKQKETKLINNGYGEISIHSIHFDRYYTEEHKEKNRKMAESMTMDEWSNHCDETAKSFEVPMMEILSKFTEKYDIHQVSEETNTLKHFNTDWDLYFYSDRGWNNRDYMTYFNLTFNKNRNVEQNMNLLNGITKLVESLDYDNIYCRIQFKAFIDEKKVNEQVKQIFKENANETINYCNMIGKIKVVKESEDGNIEYGFFKKNAWKKSYKISDTDILSMYI